jgi:hypothetical protein
MRFGFNRPGNMAQALASHPPTPQQFARALLPAPWEAYAAGRGHSRTGERP